MRKGRSSISKATSYKQIGEFWDNHDLSDHWERTQPVEFEIDLNTEVSFYPLDESLAMKVRSIAEKRSLAPEKLLNLWVQEKLQDESAG